MTESRLILLPGEPGFAEILATPPPDPGKDYAYVVMPGSGGLLARVDPGRELDEYLLGGAYQERLEEIGESLEEWEYWDLDL